MNRFSIFPNNVPGYLIFVTYCSVIVFRETVFFFSPRFFAEEGVIFFSYARSHYWLDTLLKPHLGYYSFFTNIASLVAAKAVPLRSAPLVTTIFAFIAQCIPAIIVIWGDSPLWNNSFRKIATLLIIFIVPVHWEIWLNTINSQTYFSLAALFLVFEKPPVSGMKKNCYRFILILSSFTGVVSCFLLPVYLLKAYLVREKENFYMAGIIATCVLVQAVIVVNTSGAADLLILKQAGFDASQIGDRSPAIGLPLFGSILLVKNFFLPFGGIPLAQVVTDYLHSARIAGGMLFTLLGFGGLVGFVLLLVALSSRVKGHEKIFLIGSYFSLVVPSILFSNAPFKWIMLSPIAFQRYFYVPNIIVLLIFFHSIHFERGKVFSCAANFIVLCMFLSAVVLGGRDFKSWEKHSYVVHLSWPKWKDELILWHKDNTYKIKVWPPDWRITLTGPE